MAFLPTRQEFYVNEQLRNLSIAYGQDDSEYIADRVAPLVPVQQQSGRYSVYLKEFWFQTQAQKRAPASESVGAGYRIDNSPTYFCDQWAIHHDIPWEDYANAADYLNPEQDAVELVTRHLKLRKEQLFMQQYMQPGVWGGFSRQGTVGDYEVNTDGAGYWDSATSNPIGDIDRMKRYIKRTTGFAANTLIMGNAVYNALRNQPSIRETYKYTQPGLIDEARLASVFGIDRIFVAGAIIDKSDDLTPNLDFLTDTDVLVCYVAPSPGLRRPSAMYTFDWVAAPGAGGAASNVVAKLDMPLKRATRIEAMMNFDMRITGRDLGVFAPKVIEKA